MIPFLDEFPFLFHVTRRSAIGSIRRKGLLPASAFLRRGNLTDATAGNRDTWTGVPDGNGQIVWLRWQNLRDEPLLKRLPETITPIDWRGFINDMVYFFPTKPKAEALQAFTADRAYPQAIVRYATAELFDAGCDLRLCRWNNGFLDRSKPPRLRSFADYRPICDWRKGETVQEVTARGGFPILVPFEEIA